MIVDDEYLNYVRLRGRVATNPVDIYRPNHSFNRSFKQFCIVVPHAYDLSKNNIFSIRVYSSTRDDGAGINKIQIGDLAQVIGRLRSEERLDGNGNPMIDYFVKANSVKVTKSKRKPKEPTEFIMDDFNRFAEF